MSVSQNAHLHYLTSTKLQELHNSYTATQSKYSEYEKARNNIGSASQEQQFVYISSANIFLGVDSDYAGELLDKCLVDLDSEKKKIRDEIENVQMALRRFDAGATGAATLEG